MVMRGEETQRKAQTAAAIENQQKVAQAQSVQAQVQAAAQAQPVANPAESVARLASVQQELSLPPMAQQEIAARLASYAQTTPHDVERVVIQNGRAHGDFTGIARALPEVYRVAAGRWMQQPQEQAQPQPQTQPPQPTAMPAQQDMQVPNVQANDVAVPPAQEMTAQMPQQMQGQAQAVPTTEDLADIRQKLATLDAMMQGNPAYVEARRRGDWQTAAQEAAKAGHHDFARFYQMLHEKATGAPINVTPYQNPSMKVAVERPITRPPQAPVPINTVEPMHPPVLPKSYKGRTDLGKNLAKAMRMHNIPVSNSLRDGLLKGKEGMLRHALKRVAQADMEDAILRGVAVAQQEHDGEAALAKARENRENEVQAESVQNEGEAVGAKSAREQGDNADGHMEWIAAHRFQYDESKSMEENIQRAESLAQEYLDKFGTTDRINTPERQALRRKIADDLYGNGAAKKEGKVWLVLGVPASGKSTFSDPLIEKEGALLIDSDEAKKLLPEFSNGLLAGAVHEESAKIADTIFSMAMANNDNMILPLVGKTLTSLQKKIDTLKKAGYEVNLIYVDLPIEKAIERTKARFRETGRLVSPSYLGKVGLKPKENYDKLKRTEGVDSYEAWNSDVERGSHPRLVEHSIRSEQETSAHRMGGRGQHARPLDESGRLRDSSEESRRSTLNTANRSDNQGGFSTPQKSVQAKSVPLGKQEQEALTGTSEEAKEAYRIVRDKLAKSKNKSVVRAAKVGATLFARHADIYAKAYSKATGKPYTALDYMRDRFGLDVDGTEVEANADGLKQSAPNRENLSDAEHKDLQFRIIQEMNPMRDDIHTGVRSPEDILAAKEAFQSKTDEDSYAYPDFTKADGIVALKRGSVTVYSSHPILPGAFVTPSRMQAKDYAGGGKVYSARVPIEDVAWLHSDEGQYAPLEWNGFDQRAWHGSPHDFDVFDLGAIGTGEGAQVHGWGLYFAQDRAVSEEYKARLGGSGEGYSFMGDRYEKTNDGWSFVDYYENSPGFLDYSDPLAQALDAIDSYGEVDAAIKSLQEDLESWEDDPSHPDAEQLREAIKILKEDGDDIKPLTPGSLFEVEIPENDVLLDEQKPFDKQPKFVQEKLEELFIDEDNDRKEHFAKSIKRAEDRIKDYDLVLDENAAVEKRQAAAERLIENGAIYDVPSGRALDSDFRKECRVFRFYAGDGGEDARARARP